MEQKRGIAKATGSETGLEKAGRNQCLKIRESVYRVPDPRFHRQVSQKGVCIIKYTSSKIQNMKYEI